MKWMLVERKPDVIYAGALEIYLGEDGHQTEDLAQALKFKTREDAEAHRRKLAHPYHWVATGAEPKTG